jgi:hypothetical protein
MPGASISLLSSNLPQEDRKLPSVSTEIDLTAPPPCSGLGDPEYCRKLLETLTHFTLLVADGYVHDADVVVDLIRNRMA